MPSSSPLICKASNLEYHLQSARLPPMNQNPGCPDFLHIVLSSPSSSKPCTSLTLSAISSPKIFLNCDRILRYPVAKTISSASKTSPSENLSPVGRTSSISCPCLILTLPSMINWEH